MKKQRQLIYKKIISGFWLLYLGYVSTLIIKGHEPYILYSVDLIFHEAGHFIFIFFGEFMNFLGGSLMQLLVPMLVLIHFLREKDRLGCFTATWWLGVNLVSVGRYMADARAQILPLLNENLTHDWWYLFSRMSLLEYDRIIGGSVVFLGYVFLFGAVFLGLLDLIIKQVLRKRM